jgi:ketosteroid isomerase-like protein
VAVATGVFRGTGRTASGEPLVVHNSYTFVLVKLGGRWRIKHVHESTL